MSFWPNREHWSVAIPRRTNHYLCPSLEETGFAMLTPFDGEIPAHEWESLEYMDWKSGGDTNFAPLASADGTLDCRGFWSSEQEHADKDAVFTSNAELCPTLRDYVQGVGANFGRVRIIKLEPQDRETAMRSFHRDDNNRFNPDGDGWVVRSWVELTDNPDSYMLLMDMDADGLPDPSTERRVPLPRGARFVVDTQRLENLGLHEVADAGLRHDRDGDSGLDALDHLGVAHTGDATVTTDVGRDTLERHDSARSGVFGDLRLLGGDDVHDDAALQHFGQATLHLHGAGDARRVRLLGHGSQRTVRHPRGHQRNAFRVQ